MADEIEIINKFYEIARTPQQLNFFCETPEHARKIAEHKTWLNNIRHECPSPANHDKIAVYIRYFNQTRYEDYLTFHKQQYIDTVALCPNWEIIDFYIDEGATAPNMESAPEWCRLLNDALEGKVDLIITQKVSNVSKKPHEVTLCSRILASQIPPIGIYFISEDIFTLASYYKNDMKDTFFLPTPDLQVLPENANEKKCEHND